jgi:hypothetical protein
MAKKKKAPLPHGWMGKGPRSWLRELGRTHGHIVEVGSWQGKGTLQLLAHNTGHIYCVDTWAGTPDDPEQHELYASQAAEAFGNFVRNLRPWLDEGRVSIWSMPSVVAAGLLRHKAPALGFDAVFIDADHRYEAVRDDIAAYAPMIRRGGTIAGHDYDWDGVRQAVDEAFGDRLQRGPGSVWWVTA